MKPYGMTPLLAAWALAGGGGGCLTAVPSAVQIPLTCPASGTYHWGAEELLPEQWEVYGYTAARDCEWNGVNDAGPSDVDEADPLDPRADWFYVIEPNGTYESYNTVNCSGAVECQTWEWARLDFAVTAGREYVVKAHQGGDPWMAAQIHFYVTCPGLTKMRWLSWTDNPFPLLVAPESGTCRLEAYDGCLQDPGSLPGHCTSHFEVWQR